MPNKKINLLFHIRSMEMGGIQKVLLHYLNNLPKDIFDISLMINLNQGELIREIPQGIKVYHIADGKDSFSKNPWINKIQLVFRRFLLFFYHTFPSLIYNKLHQKPDIEIAFDTNSLQFAINSPITSSKKVCWLHIDLKNTHSDDSVNLKILELMKRFDTCFIVSQYAKNNIEKHYNTILKDCHIANNPVNHSEIITKSNETPASLKHPCFIASGRINISKGHFNLLEIHKRLLDAGHHHYIYILGDGPQKQNLLNKIKEHNVEETFILLGNQNNPYPYIKEADYFIHPSHRESYPMVILESLMLNKPIVSTNVGGIPEIITNNENGILVNNNEDEIFDAMKKFLTEPELVEKIKQGTKNAKEKFDEQKIYQQVTKVFEQMALSNTH